MGTIQAQNMMQKHGKTRRARRYQKPVVLHKPSTRAEK